MTEKAFLPSDDLTVIWMILALKIIIIDLLHNALLNQQGLMYVRQAVLRT